PAHGYRTTVRLAVRDDGRVGFRAESSHRVVAVDHCLVANPALSALLGGITVDGATELQLRYSRHTGEITALPLDQRGRPARARVRGLPAGAAVGAESALTERVAGIDLRVSASSFFQSGPDAAELLVSSVRGVLGETEGPFLDAYGGVGLFGATVGGTQVVLVEESPSSCADAAVNLPDATVVRGRFEHWTPSPVSVAVADPARSGLGADAAAVLVAARARRLVLVSCDPVAMARDTAALVAHGLRHESSTVLDLFPHTPHVEVVTAFSAG
ncbi:MAG: hypothetical protein RI900_2006, partial [Actinomycetota bacterium]